MTLDRSAGDDRAGRKHCGKSQLRGPSHAEAAHSLVSGRQGCSPDDRNGNDRPRRLAEAVAGAINQLSYRAGRKLERPPDLLVAASLELSLDDRLTLRRREIANRQHERRDLLASVERLRRLLDAVVVLIELLVLTDAAVLVDRRVPHDAKEPRPEQLRPGAVLQRGVRLEQRLLDHILRA
jgi:hypothetical protein